MNAKQYRKAMQKFMDQAHELAGIEFFRRRESIYKLNSDGSLKYGAIEKASFIRTRTAIYTRLKEKTDLEYHTPKADQPRTRSKSL